MKTLTYRPTITKQGEEKLRKRFTKRLAEYIKNARKKKKMTQETLAFEAGLNSAYVGHLERGVYSPTLFVIWKICQALEVNSSDFLKDFPNSS